MVTSKYAMPEIERPSSGTTHGSGSGTNIGYKLEVRTSYATPTVIGDKYIIDNVWREFPIVPGAVPFGPNVPTRDWDADMLKHGIVSRTVAEAHAAVLLAFLEATRPAGALCVEVRLVKVEYKWSYSITEKGVSDVIMSPRYDRDDARFHPRPPFINDLQSVETEEPSR